MPKPRSRGLRPRLLPALLGLCLLLPAPLAGKTQAPPPEPTQGSRTWANPQVEETAPVRKLQLEGVELVGNKVTRDFVLLRELPVKTGEWVEEDRLNYLTEKSYENLNNLDIFNYIRVNTLPGSHEGAFVLHIEVEEQWYIWPLVSLIMEDRNFSTWVKNMDFERTTIESGLYLRNILGLNVKSIITGKFGYTRGFRFALNRISLDRSGRNLLSLDLSANTNNKLDLATQDNKPFNLRGGKIITRTHKAKLTYQYRVSLLRSFESVLSLEHTCIDSMVLKANPQYWGSGDLMRNALRLDLSYTNDHRDYHNYPTEGFYYRVELKGYHAAEGKVWGLTPELHGKYYYQWGERWSAYHLGNLMWNTGNTEAWILNKAMGYGSNVIRGYEHHVTDGSFFCSVNNSLRYKLVPTKIVVLNWLSCLPKLNKIHFTLYGNVHLDAGYTHQRHPLPHDLLSNQFLFAAGAGLDLVSYYGITLGIDYSINKQGNHGFFFTLQSPLN